MDLISREEVRRDLAFYIYQLATDALTVDEFRTKIRECIDGMPSQNKWISVSERLPELGRIVLCQCRANIYEVLKLTVDGWYYDQNHCYMENFVVAWMPLPKPYKAESEKRYRVKVWLEEEYDDIIAENEEDAFIQASDFAMSGGCWYREVEEIETIEEE